jgi:D-psicose/D-tagatose/L-ribulose 3-epimerase
MRLAISNIAWDATEDDAIATLLGRYRVDAIDIAPAKYFPDPAAATDEEIARVRDWWAKRGIEITGMQALLFGTHGLNVFGTAEVRDALLNHLSAVCRVGSGLGATRLVFGSPRNRDRSGLTDEQAIDAAVPFFRRLGDIAQRHEVSICLEPNPSCYGANFMTTSAETARVVEEIAHPAIRMQFDTGAMTINGEDVVTILAACSPLIGHVHLSEPELMPLGERSTDHEAIGAILGDYLPQHIASIEMVATRDEPHIVSIERALMVADKYYRRISEAG